MIVYTLKCGKVFHAREWLAAMLLHIPNMVYRPFSKAMHRDEIQ
jgi:hypothetical protein